MNKSENILPRVKLEVDKLIPDARVFLFGSRVTGTFTSESDWDILVLTKKKYPKKKKWELFDKLFPISLENASFINLMMVQEEEWNTNPGYYSLRKGIGEDLVEGHG